MAKTFVLRKVAYVYTDEYLAVHTIGGIENTFQTEEEAKSELLNLEREMLESLELFMMEPLAGCSTRYTKEAKAFKDFYDQRFGAGIVKMDEHGNVFCEPGVRIPRGLPDEDILQIRDILGIKFHEVSEYEGTPVFYGIWSTLENKFRTYNDALYFYNSYHDAIEASKHHLRILLSKKKLTGSPDELSETPALLNSLISSSINITYDDTQKELTIKYLKEEEAIALNELLKEKVFEIREIQMSEVENVENWMYEEM